MPYCCGGAAIIDGAGPPTPRAGPLQSNKNARERRRKTKRRRKRRQRQENRLAWKKEPKQQAKCSHETMAYTRHSKA